MDTNMLMWSTICPLSAIIGAVSLFLILRNLKMIMMPWERESPAPLQAPSAEWPQPVEFYRPEPFTKALKVEAKHIGRVVQQFERLGWTYSHCTDGAGIWWVHFLKERSWRSAQRCNYYPNNH